MHAITAEVGGGGEGGSEEGEMTTRLRISTLLSPKFRLHSVAHLIMVHKYAIPVTVHGVTATPQTCKHSRSCACMHSEDHMK